MALPVALRKSKAGAVMVFDKLDKMSDSVAVLTKNKVLVGVPASKAGRAAGKINNAALLYIHEHGDPAANIPARPAMQITIKAKQSDIKTRLRKASERALAEEGEKAVWNELAKLGMMLRDAIKATITAGIPPPLALSTVRARIRRRQSKAWRKQRRAAVAANIAAGLAPGANLFTPLIDTGALRNAIEFVIRKR